MLSKMKTINWAVVICCLTITFMTVLSAKDENDDKKLLDQFITSKGQNSSIVFDSSNIKQFWIDKSVVSKDNSIIILLNRKGSKLESIPLKIQLTNIVESLDCTVDVITTDPGFSFAVSTDVSKNLSESKEQPSFINYHVLSSTFHLEDTDDFSFCLGFNSDSKSSIKIERIILSFKKNLT